MNLKSLEPCDVCASLTTAPSIRDAQQSGVSPNLFYLCNVHHAEVNRPDTVVLPFNSMWDASAVSERNSNSVELQTGPRVTLPLCESTDMPLLYCDCEDCKRADW